MPLFYKNMKPPQIRIPYLGAMYEIAGRIAFVYSILTSIMMTSMYYGNNQYAQAIFHTYWAFVVAWVSIGVIAAVILWVFVIPSHFQLCAEQSIRGNPMYNEIIEIKQMLLEQKK